MRTLLLLAASAATFGLAGSPAHAAAPAAQIDRVPADAGAAPEAQLEALRERLLASQQTIATLERELAEEKNRGVALDRCRVKNGRLVRIGRQLVEGYQARWRQSHKDPFQLGRRRFEFEMQALSEALYDAQGEVPPRPTDQPAPASGDAAQAPAEVRAPAELQAPAAPPEAATAAPAPAGASES